MTFRTRLVVLTAAAVAVVLSVGSTITYVVYRGELLAQVDTLLRERAEEAVVEASPQQGVAVRLPPLILGGPGVHAQVVPATGELAPPPDRAQLPVSDRARAVAAGEAAPYHETLTVNGTRVRIYVHPAIPGIAVQLARPLDEMEATLSRLRLVLILVGVLGVVAAAAAGTVISRAALVPVRRLSDATTHIRATGDLTRRVGEDARDELGRLGGNFNRMLDALEDAVRSQRQLVADASHELRTPITSLRTNIEVLLQDEEVPESERQKLLDDLLGEVEQLGVLVNDLVELARDGERPEDLEEVRFASIVESVVSRARRRSPGAAFELDLDDSVVSAAPSRLERAVANLVDNALKWSPPGAAVEVTLRDGELAVRDHGPGIAPQDLPHVFERFYRSPDARRTPGSGLGLAIVRQAAEVHGGAASAERAPGGGTLMRLRLPVVTSDDVDAAQSHRP